MSPENLSAYYGLSSGLLGLAKECINTGAFTWAASLLEVNLSCNSCITFLFEALLVKNERRKELSVLIAGGI